MEQIENCVFCKHKFEWGDHKIVHILEKHIDKVPLGLVEPIVKWYSKVELRGV